MGKGDTDVFVQMVQQGREQGLVDERTFAAATDSTDPNQATERQFEVDALQVVARGALHGDGFPDALAPLLRNFDAFDAIQVLRGDRLRGKVLVGRPLGDDLSPMDARTRSDVHHVV